jgi:hypothetical protein
MATRKTQTQTQTNIDLDNIFRTGTARPVVNHTEKPKVKPEAKQDKPKVVKVNKASVAKTLAATGKIKPTKAMQDMLGKMLDIKLDDDLPSYEASIETESEVQPAKTPQRYTDGVEPKPPETLPTVVVKTTTLATTAEYALRKAGYLVPDFHQVAALPGNIKDQIRQLGRSVFKTMTTTPTNKIFVVANLGGMGPNTDREVQSVADWVRQHGQDYGDGSIDFDRSIPGYEAETHMYTAAGITWLLVKDFAGQYIYAWPEKESVFRIAVNKLLQKCA